MTRTAERVALEIDADFEGWPLDKRGRVRMPRRDVWLFVLEHGRSFANKVIKIVLGVLALLLMALPIGGLMVAIGFGMAWCMIHLLRIVTDGRIVLEGEVTMWVGYCLALLLYFLILVRWLGSRLRDEVDNERWKLPNHLAHLAKVEDEQKALKEKRRDRGRNPW